MPVDQDKLSLLVVKGLDEIPIKLEEFGVIDNNTKGPIVSTIMKISPEGKVRDAFKDFVLRVNVAPLEDVGEADVHLVALPVPLEEMSVCSDPTRDVRILVEGQVGRVGEYCHMERPNERNTAAKHGPSAEQVGVASSHRAAPDQQERGRG